MDQRKSLATPRRQARNCLGIRALHFGFTYDLERCRGLRLRLQLQKRCPAAARAAAALLIDEEAACEAEQIRSWGAARDPRLPPIPYLDEDLLNNILGAFDVTQLARNVPHQ